jgi:hypothetical protein
MKATSQLDREKALYRYSLALDRGDFETISAILEQATEDAALERMILEVNEVCQAEMVGQQAPMSAMASRHPGVLKRLLRREERRHRGGGDMTTAQFQSDRSRRSRGRLRTGLAVGGVVLGVALALLIAWGIYAPSRSPGLLPALGARRWASGSDASYEAQVVVEKVAVPQALPAPEEDSAASTASFYSYSDHDLAQPSERLIIRSGDISLIVADTRAGQQSVESMVARMAGEGAYVVSSQEYATGDAASPSIQMSIRVPATRFDEAMDGLAKLAVRVENRNESAQDVTEEYVDLEARLEAMDTARQRLLEIMGSATTTEDLLQAEQQLTEREAEIEALEGRRQYLAQSAQLASIQVNLQPSILSQPVGDRWRPAETVRRAFDTLIAALRGLGDFLIFFAIAVLPWLVVVGLALYGLVRLVLWRSRASHR